MKKLLSLLMTAMLLPFALGALDLQPNQLIMGHYTTDDLATTGWGSNALEGLSTVATDFTPDDLAFFAGGEIVAVRIGLYLSTPISRVFIIPITPDGVLLWNDITEWPCNASSVGWNMIELETPYKIDLPEGYSLRIGFDYEQATMNSKPLSIVKKGTVCPTYHLVNGEWKRLVFDSKGNLSLQCIVESDHFPEYVIRVRNINVKKLIHTGEDVSYSFETCNLGITNVPAGGCTYEIAVDGEVIATMTNPVALTQEYTPMSGVLSTDGLPTGMHTLTVTPTMVNGEPLENPTVFTATFSTYDQGFRRQMHLVEQFTSTGCTFCPQGTSNIVGLTEMRDDIAWVAIHQDMGSADPFRTLQCDTLNSYQGIDGYPEGTFDRTAGISSASKIYAVLTNLSPSTMSTFLDYVEDLNPSWGTVNVNSTYDATTRHAVITIDGELVPGFEGIMGEGSNLTVYITEDGLVAPQTSGGNDYVHNHVLRIALGSVKGVALNKTGDNYKNVFNIDIPEEWNADNLSIVAFISRPLRSGALTDLYVTNANKRKLGEYDEPAFIPGDVDGNGLVNISDVTVLIQYLLTEAIEINLNAADFTQDGEVNISDATALIQHLLSN